MTYLQSDTISDPIMVSPDQTKTSLKPNAYMVVLLLIAMIALAATYEWEWALQLSSFAFFLGKIALALICIKTIDDWVFPGINTIQKLNEGNVAVAAHQLALYVLVALALVST